MSADYAALEARVAELEHQMRHILPAKVDAIGFGVSVMHGEMTETLGEHGEQLAAIRLEQDRQREMVEMLGRGVAELLRRVPGGPSNGPAGGEDDH